MSRDTMTAIPHRLGDLRRLTFVGSALVNSRVLPDREDETVDCVLHKLEGVRDAVAAEAFPGTVDRENRRQGS